MRTSILVLTLFVGSCMALSARDSTIISRFGIQLTLPQSWNEVEGTKPPFRGIVVYGGEEGQVSLLVEKLTGNSGERIKEFRAEMVNDVSEEKITQLGDMTGEGTRTSGKNRDGDDRTYTLFYPKNRLVGWYIAGFIVGKPSEKTMKEFDGVLRSLQEKSVE